MASEAPSPEPATRLDGPSFSTLFPLLCVFCVSLSLISAAFGQARSFLSSVPGGVLLAALSLVFLLVSWRLRRLLFRVLASRRFMVSVLTIILLSSMLGTVVVQESDRAVLAWHYGDFLSPIFLALSTNDVFHSDWFAGLLALLSISLFLAPFRKERALASRLARFLSYHGMLAILVGAQIGSVAGRSGILLLKEGEVSRSFMAEKSSSKDAALLPLGFGVRLDKVGPGLDSASTIRQEARGPRDREVTIISGGKAIRTATIAVNRPLFHDGYQLVLAPDDSYAAGPSKFFVVRDPGFPLVVVGVLVAAVGFALSFFERVSPGGDRCLPS